MRPPDYAADGAGRFLHSTEAPARPPPRTCQPPSAPMRSLRRLRRYLRSPSAAPTPAYPAAPTYEVILRTEALHCQRPQRGQHRQPHLHPAAAPAAPARRPAALGRRQKTLAPAFRQCECVGMCRLSPPHRRQKQARAHLAWQSSGSSSSRHCRTMPPQRPATPHGLHRRTAAARDCQPAGLPRSLHVQADASETPGMHAVRPTAAARVGSGPCKPLAPPGEEDRPHPGIKGPPALGRPPAPPVVNSVLQQHPPRPLRRPAQLHSACHQRCQDRPGAEAPQKHAAEVVVVLQHLQDAQLPAAGGRAGGGAGRAQLGLGGRQAARLRACVAVRAGAGGAGSTLSALRLESEPPRRAHQKKSSPPPWMSSTGRACGACCGG